MSGVYAISRLKELFIRLIFFSGTGTATALNNASTAGMYRSGLNNKAGSAQGILEPSLNDLGYTRRGSMNSLLVIKIKFFLGCKICPVCGSTDIVIRGFEGVNQRYNCQCCGNESDVLC